MTNKTTLKARHDYFTAVNGEKREVMYFESTIKIHKDRGFTMSKKQWFIVKTLRQIDLRKYTQSLETLTNLYFKDMRKKGTFKSGDIINASDLKKAITYIYYNDDRLIEMYKNDKGNFLIHERDYEENLLNVVYID